jgi:hypothetical protein
MFVENSDQAALLCGIPFLMKAEQIVVLDNDSITPLLSTPV